MAAETETVIVRRDDLDVLVTACLSYLPDDLNEAARMAFGRLDDARRAAAEAAAEPEEDPRPGGFYGRVELPGWRNHTGWITEETRFGAQVAVVRDWDGRVVAEVCIGPMCQVVHLPTPLKSPEPQAAIAAGGGGPDDYDEDDEDDEDDERSWDGSF